MGETASLILTCLFSSSLSVAIVTGAKELILWRLNRKAKKEDDHERKTDYQEDIKQRLDADEKNIERILAILENLEKRLDVTTQSDRVVLKDRIRFIASSYIRKGEISYEDKKNLKEMWNIYHFGLEGNGDLDDLMKLIDELHLIV